MYRLAMYPCSEKFIPFVQEAVSKILAEVIDYILGEPDNDGIRTDVKRCVTFMEHTEYLGNLVGRNVEIETEDGSVEEISWVAVILARYNDIYKKLKDKDNEYTLDEFGEALIYELSRFIANGSYEYMQEYFDEEKYGEYTLDWYEYNILNFEEYVPDLLGDEGEKLYRDLEKQGRVYFKETVYETVTDLDAEESGEEIPEYEDWEYNKYEDEYADAYKMIWWDMITNPASYALDEPDMARDFESELPERLKHHVLTESFVFWDWDYLMTLELLCDGENVNRKLNNLHLMAGYTLKDLKGLVFEPIDDCYPSQAKRRAQRDNIT